ncbi:MAG: DUF309 domain-containing protein [Gammaproteobacteria bacterium]
MRRYTDQAFPPYRFVPGKSPHPTRDPAGHSYLKHPEPPAAFAAARWQSCPEYLFGIDLFNHGYWWEAHEALEALWVAAGRNTETGQFLQGLILIAVAHLKMFQGFDDVAIRMAKEGLDKLKHIQGIYLGIDVAALRSAVTAYCSENRQSPVTIDLVTNH